MQKAVGKLQPATRPEYSNVRGYKVNIEKSIVFLYSNNKQSGNLILNSIYRSNKTHKIPKSKSNEVCPRPP